MSNLKMHISTKLDDARKDGKVSFSFEFFPPKTAQVRNSTRFTEDGFG